MKVEFSYLMHENNQKNVKSKEQELMRKPYRLLTFLTIQV